MSFWNHTSQLGRTAAITALGVCLVVCSQGRAQNALEKGEARIALDAALDRISDLENENNTLRSSNGALAKSLAASNVEARDARNRLAEIRLELEALGVAALGEDNRELSQRLLRALGVIEQERVYRQALENQLVSLSAALTVFVSTVNESDPSARMALEGEMRSSDVLLNQRQEAAPNSANSPEETGLANALVISLKPELGLTVLNAGKKSGVQIGMPFEIFRNDRILGAALVVDVRDHICGLAFGGTAEGLSEVKVGDRARPRIGR